MKRLNRFILGFEAVVALYALWLVCVYAVALWEIHKPTLITIGLCMAIYLFLWPDRNDRKLINSKIRNPYKQ